MMLKTSLCLLAAGLLVAPALGQPNEWQDDFQTVATYDSASLFAPFYGGPPTKYTVIGALSSDIFNERVLSGNGMFMLINRDGAQTPPPLPGRVEVAVLGWLGLNIGIPGEPPLFSVSEPFSSDDICMYGGYLFSDWDLKVPVPGWEVRGPDGEPGVAGVDDDQDGTTDGSVGGINFDDDGDGTTDEWADAPEFDEIVAARPTSVNGGYGNRDGTGYQAGVDAAPGIAGVDDDGNGTIDDYNETGWAGSDDGDDRTHNLYWMMIRTDLSRSEAIYADNDLGFGGGFAIREARDLDDMEIEGENEISDGFYQAWTNYNWVFCASGTCYGAMMWVEADMGNPAETVGPVINTFHSDRSAANGVALGFIKNNNPVQFIRRYKFRVNTNFSHTFWMCSGPPTAADFANGIFGYPSPSADLDNDRDVDVNDFLTFSGCFAGSLVPPAPGCQNGQADLDVDGDVDVNDFLTFSSCFAGSLTRPNAACFPPDLTTCP